MYGRRYENWTQERAAASGTNGLQALLRLARENEAALRADLKEVAAARGAAAASLKRAGSGDAYENRRQALRRLLDSLERSEVSIRDKLAAMKAEADIFDKLIERAVDAKTGRGASIDSAGISA